MFFFIRYMQGFKFWKRLGGIFSRAVVYLLCHQGNQQSFCCSMTESQQELPMEGTTYMDISPEEPHKGQMNLTE